MKKLSVENVGSEASKLLLERVTEEFRRLAPRVVISAFDSGRPATISLTATIRPRPQKDKGGYELVVKGNSAIPGHETRDKVKLDDDLQLQLLPENQPEELEPDAEPAELLSPTGT